MKRSKHSLSHYKLLTCDMGKLIPIACFEVLPGDSIQQSTSALIRVSPLLAPVMHPVRVRIHHWFVPHRIVWDQWEDFITGGPNNDSAVSWPYIDLTDPVQKGDLADYLGLPTGVANMRVSKLPFASYYAIWNEFYRDQDLVPETVAGAVDGFVRKVAWEKDYFSAARPWPQKGPDITLPLGTRAPVKGIGMEGQVYAGPGNAYETDDTGFTTYTKFQYGNVTVGARQLFEEDPNNPGFPNIYADLTNATGVDIRDVRRAFALQRYQEARAAYGSRYTEYLRYLGVRSSDARLMRPEYLGGGKATISFSEVLQTGPDAATPGEGVANLKGHGISALRSRRYRRFFEEHGIVMSLLSVVPRVMYEQGRERMWDRTTKEHYWQRELELIGQQEIYKREIYATGVAATDAETWGYGDRYSEYRHLRSSIAGDFRDTLDFWHMARVFAGPQAPALNQAFVECDPTKRINADTTSHNLWIMANHNIAARRLVGKQTIGRVI